MKRSPAYERFFFRADATEFLNYPKITCFWRAGNIMILSVVMCTDDQK